MADAFNAVVELNKQMARELRRIGRIVGRQGLISERASLPGAQGEWARNVESVNELIDLLSEPAVEVSRVLGAVADGNLSERMPLARRGRQLTGEFRRWAKTVNTMVDQLNAFASEVTRVAREVGTEGKLGGQADVRGVGGTWKDLTDSVNSMAGNLTAQVRNIAEVTTAVANGDLSKKITVNVQGEILELKDTINTMVDQLNMLASEVTRVAHEVGTEGKLGGQADVHGVGGTWKELTDNLNIMSANLTARARNIAEVTTAVAMGDLSKKITVDVRGEFLDQKNTINTMVDQLNAFAGEVTRVAREVGTEGKLGGQADVRGVAGTWKDLTDSVNQLAANLTTQVRAIGEVATAVTRGDLSRSIQVSASGEVEVLKDDLNEMIRRLRDSTRENTDQVWLKANLARFSGMLQGERDLEKVARLVMSDLAPLVGVLTAAFYIRESEGEAHYLRLLGQYATGSPGPPQRIEFGEGLLGQSAAERRRIVVEAVPAEYAVVSSALGRASPGMIVVVPVLFEGEPLAVLELAAFDRFSEVQLDFLDQLSETIGIVLNTITANQHMAAFAREQAGRAEAEAGLARLRQVVDVMPEGILIADGNGSIYLHNAAAADIMGTVPELVTSEVGAPVVRHLDGSICPPGELPLARAVHQREVVRGQQLIVTNAVTGREVPILVNSAPLSDPLQGAAGGVAVFQDIGPLHELEQQRDQFLAAISHDLRTPVAVIKGRANLLERAVSRAGKPDVDQLASGLRAIDDSTARLVRLIDELLDLMQLRMGHPIDLDLAPTDLIEVTRRVAGEYDGLRPEPRIRLVNEVESLVGSWDTARIERVVANLLSNAVKYSETNSEISVRATSEDGDGDGDGQPWAILAVRNRGIGIPAAELDRVFDTYYRGSNVASSISGTGVGLAGVRHIVEQHGGRVEVESVEGQTTTFTVRLPLVPDGAEPSERANRRRTAGGESP
jgi:PAS domain S-box-containing protein